MTFIWLQVTKLWPNHLSPSVLKQQEAAAEVAAAANAAPEQAAAAGDCSRQSQPNHLSGNGHMQANACSCYRCCRQQELAASPAASTPTQVGVGGGAAAAAYPAGAEASSCALASEESLYAEFQRRYGYEPTPLS